MSFLDVDELHLDRTMRQVTPERLHPKQPCGSKIRFASRRWHRSEEFEFAAIAFHLEVSCNKSASNLHSSLSSLVHVDPPCTHGYCCQSSRYILSKWTVPRRQNHSRNQFPPELVKYGMWMVACFDLSHCAVRDVRRRSCQTEDQILFTAELKGRSAVPAHDCAAALNRRQRSASLGLNKRMPETLYVPQLTSLTAVHMKSSSTVEHLFHDLASRLHELLYIEAFLDSNLLLIDMIERLIVLDVNVHVSDINIVHPGISQYSSLILLRVFIFCLCKSPPLATI